MSGCLRSRSVVHRRYGTPTLGDTMRFPIGPHLLLLAVMTSGGLLLFCGGPSTPPPAAAVPAASGRADSGTMPLGLSRAEEHASKQAPVDAGASTTFEPEGIAVGMSGPGTPFGTTDGGLGVGNGRAVKRDGGAPAHGQLDASEIRRVVRADMARYQQCYEAALGKTPTLAGKVSVHFVIGLDGSVVSAENRGSTLADETVVECVVRAFSKLRFPTPKGGAVNVVYPLDFAAKK